MMKKNLQKILLIAIFAAILPLADIVAQDELSNIKDWLHFKDAPDELYNHLSGQAFELLENRRLAVEDIQTLSDWQTRQKWIRETMLDIVGPFPEKTPLNARIIRTIKKDYFKVEHIIFESQPGFNVTSSLYIPDGLKRNEKAPVVIYCSGHSEPGYRSNVYQHVIMNLVKKGFIVFAFDPLGQGERLEYFDPQTGKSVIGGPTREHSYPGAQAFITGSSQARYMIWDGIRAVDYLLTRKEVDPARIGITGRSGGGTQSAYIAAMDERIYATAPECYITNFTRLLQTRGPQDAEQNLFNGIWRGIDQPDFLIVRAPKPALMVTTINDMFNIHGARETAEEVTRVYKAYGKSENFGMCEDIAPHASTLKNREAMYAFFQKHLNNPGSSADEELELLTGEELRVTNTGQVSTSPGSETVFSLNSREADKLRDRLLQSGTDLPSHLPQVIEASKRLSGFTEPMNIGKPVFTGCLEREGYLVEKYFVRGEGTYIIPYLKYVPDDLNGKALIYLHSEGAKTDSAGSAEIEGFVRQGYIVLAPDLIGTGEMGSEELSSNQEVGAMSYRLWYASILVNKSITGIWAGDIIRLCRILERDKGIKEISGIAKGNMAPALLHAAAFYPPISRIALIEPLVSYHSLVTTRFYSTTYVHNTVAGALQSYDLPDLAASLAPRRLLMTGVVDGAGKAMEQSGINDELAVVRAAYKLKNAESKLNLVISRERSLYDILKEWGEND